MRDHEEPDTDDIEGLEPTDESDDAHNGLEMMDDHDLDEPRGRWGGTITFVSGALLGALVGAGIALLVTPERGSVMRKRLRKLARKMQSQAQEKFEDLAEDAGRELARRRRKLRQKIRAKI